MKSEEVEFITRKGEHTIIVLTNEVLIIEDPMETVYDGMFSTNDEYRNELINSHNTKTTPKDEYNDKESSGDKPES